MTFQNRQWTPPSVSDDHLTFECRITELSTCFDNYNLAFKNISGKSLCLSSKLMKIQNAKKKSITWFLEEIRNITRLRAIVFTHPLGQHCLWYGSVPVLFGSRWCLESLQEWELQTLVKMRRVLLSLGQEPDFAKRVIGWYGGSYGSSKLDLTSPAKLDWVPFLRGCLHNITL